MTAQAETVTLLNRTIELVLPEGYCQAGNHQAEAEMMNQMKAALGNTNQLLLAFANCKELSDLRKGKRSTLDNYGQFLAPTQKGQVRVLAGLPRSEYIKKIKEQAGHLPDAIKKAEARAKQFNPRLVSTENLGLLDTDPNGVYLGMLMAYKDNAGKSKPVSCILGMTLIKEIPVSINLYQAIKKSPDLQSILMRQKRSLADLVMANK